MPYDEPNNIIRDNKEDMSVTDKATAGTEIWSRKKLKRLKIKTPCHSNKIYAEFKWKIYTSNNTDNWNYYKIFQKIPEQQTWEAKPEGTIEDVDTRHCQFALESADEGT